MRFNDHRRSAISQHTPELMQNVLALPGDLWPRCLLYFFLLLLSVIPCGVSHGSWTQRTDIHGALGLTTEAPRLIPAPVSIQVDSSAGVCHLSSDYRINIEGSESPGIGKKMKPEKWMRSLETVIKTELDRVLPGASFGHIPRPVEGTPAEILLSLQPDLSLESAVKDETLPTEEQLGEGYVLSVKPGKVQITAPTSSGLYYGIQSLIQLIEQYHIDGASAEIPALCVTDYPQYSWRGFMLDVSRHFYSVQEIKKLLDVMSRYKLNIFHWHLTDDHGWRLQIKRYPRLTSVGAWRQEWPGSVFFNDRSDTITGPAYRYGGFYTQKEAREVVAYAALRGITVVPEIELPGHSAAALAAYPEYGTSGKPQEVANSKGFARASVSEYNPGNPKTFTFLENIFLEVMDIFPSKYIHIGGDEVGKGNWKKSPECQALMQKEGLTSYEELQSYFINRMGRFLERHGRKIIGWDEALQGDLLPSATITYWRSYAKNAPLKAVSRGHGFINVCSDPLYFNRYQAGPEGESLAAPHSMNTLERVYGYQMTPEGLTADQQKLVKGGQAAIWTEFFSTSEAVEYMLLPRLLALAENLWTPGDKKNYVHFFQALPRELRSLDARGYQYRRLDP